jgi:hypothetical protein
MSSYDLRGSNIILDVGYICPVIDDVETDTLPYAHKT